MSRYPLWPPILLAVFRALGADTATRATNTTYGFHASGIAATEAQVFDFSVNKHPVLTIYDAGGNDTLDLSGYVTASKIDLIAGHYSSAAGITNNIAIAYNTTVENAVGGFGNDAITGNDASNVLSGGAGNDWISGGLGNDTLDGGTGRDTLIGGAGNDTYIVDNLSDAVTEKMGEGIDTVKSSLSFVLSANVENLTLTGTSHLAGTGNDLANVITGNGAGDWLSGGAGNDTLLGGAGNDVLNGGTGNDWLRGMLGNDNLTGGAGSDVFDFRDLLAKSPVAVTDVITDFTAIGLVHDVIEFSKLLASSFDYIVSHHELAQSGFNTVLKVTANESITLVNVNVNQLTASDFLFV